MASNYVIIKQTKSGGIAILLVFLFGPIGMFYSTIKGALIMLFVVPIITIVLGILFYNGMKNSEDSTLHFVYSSLTAGTVVFAFLGYWIMCLVWAYNAVKKYNEGLVYEQETQLRKQNKENQNRVTENKETDASLISQLEQLTTLKEKGVLTEEQYDLKALEIKEKLIVGKKASPIKSNVNPVNKPQEYKYEANNKSLYIALSILALVLALGIYLYYANDDKAKSEQLNTEENNGSNTLDNTERKATPSNNNTNEIKSVGVDNTENGEIEIKLLNTYLSNIKTDGSDFEGNFNKETTTVEDYLKSIYPNRETKIEMETNGEYSVSISIFIDSNSDNNYPLYETFKYSKISGDITYIGIQMGE